MIARIICLLLALSAASSAEDGRAALERGLELLRRQHYQEALDALETAKRTLPSQAQVYNLLGITLTKLGRIPEANKDFRKAVELNPKLADPHKNLGFNYWTSGQEAEAEQSFQAALKLNPTDEFAHYGLGTVYLRQGRAADAIAHLERARSLVDREQQVSLGLGRAYLASRQFPKAVELLESVTHQRPTDADAAALLALAYESSGNLPRALENYDRAVRLDPGNQDRYLDYTRLLLDLDRFDDSIKAVREGLQKAQDSYALHLRLGATELMKGNPEKAEGSFREAIAMHPEVPLGYIALAKVFMKSGRGPEAVAVLEEARGKLAADFLLEYFYGLALERLDRDSQAAEAFSRSSELSPAVPEAHFHSGKLLFKLGRTEDARAELQRAIELDPKHLGAHFQLSRVYAKLGDASNAKKFAARAADLRKHQVELSQQKQNTLMPGPVEKHAPARE
ncbi:MAG: hypothetical protein DMG57_22105 [Acidobacteria bacterium]|nr:MAG: hypothetical protein DMG57_22105 [Acidobacteriota bacterium]